MDVSGRIAQANGRLKASRVRVTIQQIGEEMAGFGVPFDSFVTAGGVCPEVGGSVREEGKKVIPLWDEFEFG